MTRRRALTWLSLLADGMTYYSCRDLLFSCSGPRGIRTPDLLNAIETRSQLRYGPGIIMNTFVDLRGFEPLTFSVRLRRAPNCATGPNSKCRIFYLRGIVLSMNRCE